MDGDYILLHFDHPHDHPYYLRGHVTKERAQEVLEYEEEITVKAVAHKYGRAVRVGQDHPDAIDGLKSTFRVIDAPRRSYYPVTECEPLLPFNAGLSAGRGRDAAAKVALVGDAAIAALRDLDARLRECMALGLSAAEAYDSGYQEATAAALAVVAA